MKEPAVFPESRTLDVSTSVTAPGDALSSARRDPRARLVWLTVPLLAIIAWAPVARLWFVADDFGHLQFHWQLPFPQPFLYVPNGVMFYRPLSTSLTWELGYWLFGTNALPYHLVSIGLHALAAWLLARAVATISGATRIGWLAGALFAVYPLSTEALGWLADQWDIWAAVCALGAVWGFAVAWRSHDRRPYLVALALTTVGVFMKESMLPLPLMLPVVALVIELGPAGPQEPALPRAARWWWAFARRAVLWTAPFLLPALLFLGIRLANGGVGGYPNAATDYQHFFWTALVAAGLQLLAPLNQSVFPRALVQAVGLVLTAGLVVGLVLWGRRRWPVLLLGAVWMLVFLLPVLNLVPFPPPTDLTGNRVLYFSTIGFCVVLAVLLTGPLDVPGRAWLGALPAGVLVLALVPMTWRQLDPWVQASHQTQAVVAEMDRLLVPLAGRRVEFDVQDLPRLYQGSYVFWNGFDYALGLFAHQGGQIAVQEVPRLDPRHTTSLAVGTTGAYNLSFAFDPGSRLYRVSQLHGITVAVPPPEGSDYVWSYTGCGANVSTSWQAHDATLACVPNAPTPPLPGAGYARFTPVTADGQLALPDLHLDLSRARWLRLGVSARLPDKQPGRLGDWFWGTATEVAWSEDRHETFTLDASGAWRTYWTYIPVNRLGTQVSGLRFDPVNARFPVDLAWIAATPIP
jgi:hypothetical protein